jgi:ribosomal protein S18 acetylase RimI-like enzyme
MIIRSATEDDCGWIAVTLLERWGATVIVTGSRATDAAILPALVALDASDERVGLLTYRLAPDGLEVVTIDSLRPGEGIGTALMSRAADLARAAGVLRLWLITTNDNLKALGFYQRRGLRIVAVRRGAVDEARALKASIPFVGESGIELHDEIELELNFVVK